MTSGWGLPPNLSSQVAQPSSELIFRPKAGPIVAVASGPQARGWAAFGHKGMVAPVPGPELHPVPSSAGLRGLFLELRREPGLGPMAQGQSPTLKEPEDRVEGLGEDGMEGMQGLGPGLQAVEGEAARSQVQVHAQEPPRHLWEELGLPVVPGLRPVLLNTEPPGAWPAPDVVRVGPPACAASGLGRRRPESPSG